jgi:hypothetical protein
MKLKFLIACLLVVLLIPPAANAQKRQKAVFTGMCNVYLGFDPTFEKKQVIDSLNKWFGKAKAAQITENVNVNNWPQFMIGVLSSLDTAVIGEYARKLHCWKIATIEKKNILLEVRPEDNQHLGQADFKKPFYMYIADGQEVALVKEWNGSPGNNTEPGTNDELVKGNNSGKQPPVAGSGGDKDVLKFDIFPDDDELTRKNFIAAIKKLKTKAGRTVQQEILKQEIPAGMAFQISLPYPPEMRRYIYVLTDGADNGAVFQLDLEGSDKLLKPSHLGSNMGNYSLSYNISIGKVIYAWINSPENKTVNATVVVLTEKDEKEYAKYKKEKDEADQKNAASKKGKEVKYVNENFNNDAAMRKRRSYYEDYADKIQRMANEARSDGEKWELGKQIDTYNRLTNLTRTLADDLDKFPFEYSAGNPRRAHYESLYAAVKDAYTGITKKITDLEGRLHEAKQSGKKLSSYTLYTALDDITRIARKAQKTGLD